MGSKGLDAAAAAAAEHGLHYREITGGLIQTRAEVQSRKPQPDVIVVIDMTDEDDIKIIKELLGTPSLVFKVTAIDTMDGINITMHIKLKHPVT